MHKIQMMDYFKKYIFPDLQLRGTHGPQRMEQVAIPELVLGTPIQTNPVRWMTQCRLYCQVCHDYSANSKVALIKHLDSAHAMADWKYLLKFRTWYKKEDMKHYQCRICAQQVLLSETSIRIHTWAYHHILPKNYFRKYELKKTFTKGELENLNVYKLKI